MAAFAPFVLLLAAGASSRMAPRDKLLELIDGTALLTRIAGAAVDSGCPVVVTLAPDRPDRMAALQGLDVTPVAVAAPQLGLSASLRAGLAQIPATAPVLVLLADLPEITGEDLRLVVDTWRGCPDLIVRGCAADGTPGHPVGFPPWARAELGKLEADQGARDVVQRHPARLRLIPLPGRHATTDLDTPEEWAAWRARNS